MSEPNKSGDDHANGIVSPSTLHSSKPPSLVEEKGKSPKQIEGASLDCPNGPKARYDSSEDALESSGGSPTNRKWNLSPNLSSAAPVPTMEESRNETEHAAEPRLRPSISQETPKDQGVSGEQRRNTTWKVVASSDEKRDLWQLESPTTPTQREIQLKAKCTETASPRSSGASSPRHKESMGRYNPSPPNGWPQRSPIKASHAQIHEAPSFNLFTNSFETLSEHGNYLHENQPRDGNYCSSPTKTPGENGPHGTFPRKLAVANGTENDSDSSIGDISPIKLMKHSRNGETCTSISTTFHKPVHHQTSNKTLGMQSHRGAFNGPVAIRAFRADQARTSYGFNLGGSSGEPGQGGTEAQDSNPFFVLRSVKLAFRCCTYQLPCLYEADVCPVNLGQYSNIRRYRENEADPNDILTAARRVETAIIAMGGQVSTNQLSPNHAASIFRLNGHRKTPSREFYDQRFHQRYYVSSHRVSWDVEENPPVHLEPTDLGRGPVNGNLDCSYDASLRRNVANNTPSCQDRNNPGTNTSPSSAGSVITSDIQQKTKYRCKLCGQLKQNHDCPYQQSLQRSIAIMVYPAVNAFTACEPGILTKPLSKMNNFVCYEENEREFIGHAARYQRPIQVAHVTPETKSRNGTLQSPQSSLSTDSPDALSPKKRMSVSLDGQTLPHATRVANMFKNDLSVGASGIRKRSHSHLSDTMQGEITKPRSRSQFMESLTLRPEHYRAVSRPKVKGGTDVKPSDTYQYPHVPLSFAERKRLSDTLFYLSRDVPSMSRDIASLLRGARERQEWDLAVAELLTQVIVCRYCREGDHRLDGLHYYLLRMGISC